MDVPAGRRADAKVDHVAAKVVRLPFTDHRLPRPAHLTAGPPGDRRRRVHRFFLKLADFKYAHFSLLAFNCRIRRCVWLSPTSFRHNYNTRREWLKTAGTFAPKHVGAGSNLPLPF